MSFWDDIKKFAQPYDEDDYDDYEDEELDEGYEEEDNAPRYGARRESASESASAGFAAPAASASAAPTGFAGTVVGGTMSSAKHQLVLLRPESFNDAPAFATNLREKKAVVLNLEGVDKNLARRVVDFLSGCVYSLDGSVKKVSQATYMFCPRDMEVVGDLKALQGEVENYI